MQGAWACGWLALGAALTACTSDRADLVIVNGGEAALLDPQLGSGMAEARIGLALHAGLTRLDPRTLAPLPDLAESWTSDAAGRLWSFRLRPRLTWSDGSPLSAADLLASWDRLRDPATASPWRDWLAGAAWSAAPDPEGREVITVRFDAARPAFAEMTAMPQLAPIHSTLRAAAPGTLPQPLISSGPFALERRVVRDRTRVRRNASYWNAARVSLQSLDFLALDSQFTGLNLFLAGEADFLPSVPALAAPRLRAEYASSFRPSPQFAALFLRLNVRQPALASRALRRALAMSVDRAALSAALGGLRAPADTFVPPVLAGWQGARVAVAQFALEAARAELATARAEWMAAGLDPERTLASLELLAPASELNRDLASVLREQWRAHLGIEVRLRLLEGREARAAESAGDFQISRSSWVGDYLDPDTFLSLFRSGAPGNRTGWSDAAYDQLLREAGDAPDGARRMELLAAAEALLLEAAVVIPLLVDANQELVAADLVGFHPNPRGHVDWSALARRP